MRILHFADLHLGVESYHSGQLCCNCAIIALVEVRDGVHCRHQEGT